MSECQVCGEKDFEEIDGHFYCTLCNTQSQSMRVMEADVDEGEAVRFFEVIHEKKSKEHEPKKAVKDLGRPWSIYELYQVILLHQVEALVRLGAHPDLKDIVFKLWVNYLAKLGVAFTDKPLQEKIQKYGRQREMFKPTTKKPKVKNVLGRRRRKKTVGLSAKQQEKQKLADAVAGMEFAEGDNPAEEEEESDYSSEEEEDLELWGMSRKHMDNKSVYRMQMAHTLGLCYLGLTHTNPLTTVTDLVRWAKSGKLPYKNVKDIIPKDMKFCINDWKLLGQGKVPSPERLREVSGSLAFYLQVTDFPDFPIQQLISKYIIMLDLPADLHSYTVHIVEILEPVVSYRPDKRFHRIIFWEGLAMACIVITLKSLFGLDNHTERLFSVFSRDIMRLVDNNLNLFVWDDWLAHIRNKFFLEEQGEDAGPELRKVRDTSGNVYSDINDKLFQPRTREDILKPLLALGESMKKSKEAKENEQTDNQKKRGATSQSVVSEESVPDLDLSTNTMLDEDPVGYLLGNYGDDASEQLDIEEEQNKRCRNMNKIQRQWKEIEAKGKKLRESSIQHVIYPDSFLDNLDKHGLMDATIHSSCISDVKSDITESDLQSVDVMDHVESHLNAEKIKMDKQFKQSLRKYIEKNIGHEPSTSKIVNKERYEFVIEQVKRLKKNFLLTFDPESTQHCMSYTWLIQMCSHVIHCSPDALQGEVRKYEVKLFAEFDDLDSSGRRNWKTLRRNARHSAKRLKKF